MLLKPVFIYLFIFDLEKPKYALSYFCNECL